MQRTKELPNLQNFIGTERYYKHNMGPFKTPFFYTDGVHYVAEAAKAYWLLDVIVSHAMGHYKKHDFMNASLKVQDDNTAWFELEDGNGTVLAQQMIEYTDFPAHQIQFFIENGGDMFVIMLPSEH